MKLTNQFFHAGKEPKSSDGHGHKGPATSGLLERCLPALQIIVAVSNTLWTVTGMLAITSETLPDHITIDSS